MTVLDDCDVSQSFTHSPSSESVKSSVSDGYLNKPSLAKRRANQQETELFYFNVRTVDTGQQMGVACYMNTPTCDVIKIELSNILKLILMTRTS